METDRESPLVFVTKAWVATCRGGGAGAISGVLGHVRCVVWRDKPNDPPARNAYYPEIIGWHPFGRADRPGRTPSTTP